MRTTTSSVAAAWFSGLVATLLCAPLLTGCSSTPKGSEGAPAGQSEAGASPTPAASGPAAPASAPQEDSVVVIRKGEKRSPEAAFLGEPHPGNVSIDLKNASLSDIVLPLFSRQAGIVIEYGGPPRKVDRLRLNDVPWRDALGILCRFTQTHVLHSQIPGRLELKLGYADPTAFLAKVEPGKPDPQASRDTSGFRDDPGAKGGITVSGGKSGAGAATSSAPLTSAAEPTTQGGNPYRSPSTATGSDPTDIGEPSQGYNDRVDQIRRGVSTTNSGAK